MPSFSKHSQANLETVHPDLQRLFSEVIKHRDCSIICGHRPEKLQSLLYKGGYSKVPFPYSTHNDFPSKGVDALFYPFTNWGDKRRFRRFAMFVLKKAKEMEIDIRWGGHWKTFYDAVHFELYQKP